VLDVTTGTVRVLLDDPEGDVRDPAVDYDGKRIVFAYRKGGENQFHLYAIQSDGSQLTQPVETYGRGARTVRLRSRYPADFE
jgi:Tol biopolymer transport system component